MTQQLHNRVLMATVKKMKAAHEDTAAGLGTGSAMNIGADLHRERAGEKKRLHTSSSTSSTTSSASDQCPLLPSPKSPADESRSRSVGGGGDLGLDLSLGSYPSTDSLHVLGELLCDIRRSCTTSLTSTPIISSDGDGEITAGADTVFESKLRRSATELRAMGQAELQGIVETLTREVEGQSNLLIRLLQLRDKRAAKLEKLYHRMTAILKDYAIKNGLNSELTFNVTPPLSDEDYEKWLNAWKVLSRLPKGIPKHWRKLLWSHLATQGTRHLDWHSILLTSFSEYTMPGDEALDAQIVKDLHRTGNTGFTTEEEHGILKRVLLAYARYNKATGYCQGFNILAALILKVVEFDEHLTLKIMVFLIDHILPENYFAQNLYALSADMATFREFLKHFLPELSIHIDDLQKAASGTVKKSYSSENPPDLHSIHAYEPPLADVFTMQWFLTIFATALPRKATRQVWDAIFLQGSEFMIYTATAVMAIMERELLQTATAADFYTVMAQLGERLRKAQMLPSPEFMQIVFAIQDCASASDSSIPAIEQLREKYTYNVCPCALPEDEEAELSRHDNGRPCPPPSRGGAFGPPMSQCGVKGEDGSGSPTQQRKKSKFRAKKKTFVEDQLSSSTLPTTDENQPIREQIRLLREHYSLTARQPSLIRCYMDLTPPRARAICPQTKKTLVSSDLTPQPMYGIDVPDDVVKRSQQLSGYSTLKELKKHDKRVFTISYTQPDPEELEGIELGPQDWTSWGSGGGGGGGGKRGGRPMAEAPGVGKAKSYSAERDLLLRYASGRHLPW